VVLIADLPYSYIAPQKSCARCFNGELKLLFLLHNINSEHFANPSGKISFIGSILIARLL